MNSPFVDRLRHRQVRHMLTLLTSYWVFVRVATVDLPIFATFGPGRHKTEVKYDILIVTAFYHLYESVLFWNRLSLALRFHHLAMAILVAGYYGIYHYGDYLETYFLWYLTFGTHWVHSVFSTFLVNSREYRRVVLAVLELPVIVMLFANTAFLDGQQRIIAVSYLIVYICSKTQTWLTGLIQTTRLRCLV